MQVSSPSCIYRVARDVADTLAVAFMHTRSYFPSHCISDDFLLNVHAIPVRQRTKSPENHARYTEATQQTR